MTRLYRAYKHNYIINEKNIIGPATAKKTDDIRKLYEQSFMYNYKTGIVVLLER